MDFVKKSLLFDLLLEKRFHALRYGLFFFLLLIFSIPEILFNYDVVSEMSTPIKNPQVFGVEEVTTVRYNYGLIITLIINSFMSKVVTMIIMIKVLGPRFLERNRFAQFLFFLVLLMLAFISLQYIAEGYICKLFGYESFRSKGNIGYIFLDILVMNTQWFVVAVTAQMSHAIRNWSEEMQLRQQQHTEKLKMESGMVKQHISPDVLCTTLHICGEKAALDSDLVSSTLLKLSHVLRYQLYDSRREYSLLKSEIDFMNEYLEMLRFDGFCKTFNVSVEGQVMGLVVPPLIFTSVMQYEEAVDNIDCRFIVGDDKLTFTLTDGRQSVNLSAINIRLTTVYGTNYFVGHADGTLRITIPIK